MIQISPGTPFFVVTEPIAFNSRLKGTLALCRDILEVEPMDGTWFLFRNRSGTMLRIICYDGDGFWLLEKRFSKGKIKHWPTDAAPLSKLGARELALIVWRGNPDGAEFPDLWKPIEMTGS